jgi:hypothetical protein
MFAPSSGEPSIYSSSISKKTISRQFALAANQPFLLQLIPQPQETIYCRMHQNCLLCRLGSSTSKLVTTLSGFTNTSIRLYFGTRTFSSKITMDENPTVTSRTAPTSPAPTIINSRLILDRSPLDYTLTQSSHGALIFQSSSRSPNHRCTVHLTYKQSPRFPALLPSANNASPLPNSSQDIITSITTQGIHPRSIP